MFRTLVECDILTILFVAQLLLYARVVLFYDAAVAYERSSKSCRAQRVVRYASKIAGAQTFIVERKREFGSYF